MKPDRLSEFFGDIRLGEFIDKCDSNGKLSLQVIDKAGIKTEITVTRETKTQSTAPGFLDTIIIILVAAAAVLFLLWATSRTMGINAFESLPAWLERSYHAIWVAVASGSTGIGLAIVQAFRRRENPRPNYLLYILLTTTAMIGFIFLLPLAFHRADANNTKKYVEAHLISGGFKPSFMNDSPQLPGSSCGQDTVLFTPGEVDSTQNETNKLKDGTISAKVEQPISVHWDASYICRRQGIKGVDGRVDWGTPNRDASRLPTDEGRFGPYVSYGEWGTLKFKYFLPGNYTVKLAMATHCRADKGEPENRCTAEGEFDVHIEH